MRYLHADDLKSPVARTRALAALSAVEAAAGDQISTLKELLEDDAPYVVVRGDRRLVAEVRAAALAALQGLYREMRRRPDFGSVVVREAMPAAEVRRRATAAVESLSEPQRQSLREDIERFLADRVQPSDRDRKLLAQYRALQELGKIDYSLEEVDPDSFMTARQRDIAESQLHSERPRPHLRFRTLDGRTIGFLYRHRGRWIEDFAEDPASSEAIEMIRRVMTIEPEHVPILRHDQAGEPVRAEAGHFIFEGKVPLATGDEVEILRTMRAFCLGRFDVELSR